MSTGMNLGARGVAAMITYAGETVAIAGAGTSKVVAGTTTVRGDLKGFTQATGVLTATFPGTRLIRIKAVLLLAPIATNVDNLVLQIRINDVNVFAGASNDINDTTPENFEVEYNALIKNGDTIKLYVINVDTAADIIVAAYVERINALLSSGYLQVQGA